MKEDLLKIIDHYGVMEQLKYFQSEVFELNEAIIQAENYTPNPNDSFTKMTINTNNYVEHIAEEIADVFMMLKQFQYYYGIGVNEIEKVVDYKIKRQLDRIDEENKYLKEDFKRHIDRINELTNRIDKAIERLEELQNEIFDETRGNMVRNIIDILKGSDKE